MTWKVRLTLSLFTAVAAVAFGALGGFLGPKLPGWIWFGFTVVLAVMLLPWDAPVFSQEEMLQEMGSLDKAIDELVALQPKLREMHAELDAAGGLKQEELDQWSANFTELKTLSPTSQQAFRETMFAAYRRALVVQVIALAVAGIGGALMAHMFARLLS